MSELKAHRPAGDDLDDSGRGDSSAGIVAVLLGGLLVLGLIGGVVVVGFVLYASRTRMLAEERARMMELVEMERMQAQLAAARAEANAKLAANQASQLADAIASGAVQPAPPPGPSPEEQFAAEIEPLNQAVADMPDDPEVWKARARVLQRWQKWREAAEDYEHYLELNPVNLWIRLEAAATRFACGDREAYLAHCKLAEERLATKPEPTIEHNRAARVLCLGPGALTIGEQLLVLAQDQPLKNPGKWWLLEPMAALQYRTGRYEEALQTLDQTRPLAWNNAQKAANEIWAAMAFHQLGRRDEAAQALAAAEQHVVNGVPAPGTDSAGGDAVIIAQKMLEEAKELISSSVVPNNNTEN
jgi:tetratricopeptide (TPR) repeat protein